MPQNFSIPMAICTVSRCASLQKSLWGPWDIENWLAEVLFLDRPLHSPLPEIWPFRPEGENLWQEQPPRIVGLLCAVGGCLLELCSTIHQRIESRHSEEVAGKLLPPGGIRECSILGRRRIKSRHSGEVAEKLLAPRVVRECSTFRRLKN